MLNCQRSLRRSGLKNRTPPTIEGSEVSLRIREIRHQPRTSDTTVTQLPPEEETEYSCKAVTVKAPKRFGQKKFWPPSRLYAQIGQMVLAEDPGEQENQTWVLPKPAKTLQQWRRSDSNRRPSRCKRDALPTELRPLTASHLEVGVPRLELGTSSLSGMRSNQLSYTPLFDTFSQNARKSYGKPI